MRGNLALQPVEGEREDPEFGELANHRRKLSEQGTGALPAAPSDSETVERELGEIGARVPVTSAVSGEVDGDDARRRVAEDAVPGTVVGVVTAAAAGGPRGQHAGRVGEGVFELEEDGFVGTGWNGVVLGKGEEKEEEEEDEVELGSEGTPFDH